MALQPPSVCRRIRQLHAMLGSSNENERKQADKHLRAMLTKHRLTWNDLPAILAQADADDRADGSSAISRSRRGWRCCRR
jgi:hypothetical protein